MSAAHILEPVVDPEWARPEFEDALARVESLSGGHRDGDALAALAEAAPAPGTFPDLALRMLFAESWARMQLGQLDQAAALLERAAVLSAAPGVAPGERAEALFRLGCCRLEEGLTAEAAALLTLALDATAEPRRSRILVWRARAYRLQANWGAARADLECALELAEASGDLETAAHGHLEASLVAGREGQSMIARCDGERAKALFAELGDRVYLGRAATNLGRLVCKSGELDTAKQLLAEGHALAVEAGIPVDAAEALASLAQVELAGAEAQAAELHAIEALDLLASRPASAEQRGNTQLVLARALLEQGRHDECAHELDLAEFAFADLGSSSKRASVTLVRGDLAKARGDWASAAQLYRSAAAALQDIRF